MRFNAVATEEHFPRLADAEDDSGAGALCTGKVSRHIYGGRTKLGGQFVQDVYGLPAQIRTKLVTGDKLKTELFSEFLLQGLFLLRVADFLSDKQVCLGIRQRIKCSYKGVHCLVVAI